MGDNESNERNWRPRQIFFFVIASAILALGTLVASYRFEPAAAVRDSRASNPAADDTAARHPSVESHAVHERSAKHVPAQAPLPLAGTPLAQTYHQLKALADAGDAAAAARLYTEVTQCFQARERLRMLPLQASVLGNTPASLSADQLAAREQRLASVEQELTRAEQDAAPCKGMSDEQLRLAPAAFTAALLGDKTASDCYVSGLPLFAGGILDHPEWLAQYRDNALTIANNAIAGGDWDMVDELQRAYSPNGFRIGPVADLVGEDAAMEYRLLRLKRLGTAEAHAAEGLDRQIANAARELPVAAIETGDTWAQDTFSNYFRSGPPPSGNNHMGCN